VTKKGKEGGVKQVCAAWRWRKKRGKRGRGVRCFLVACVRRGGGKGWAWETINSERKRGRMEMRRIRWRGIGRRKEDCICRGFVERAGEEKKGGGEQVKM